MTKNQCPNHAYYSGRRVLSPPINGDTNIAQLVQKLHAYNGARFREACDLVANHMWQEDVTIGVSLAGALTPAGLGPSSIIPLMNHGYVDWIVATGANMYHDIHFAFNMPLFEGSPNVNDVDMRKRGVTRIYDVRLDYKDVLMATDQELRKILLRPEFQHEMGTQEFYHILGGILNEYEARNGIGEVSILAAAHRLGIPVFTSSPGDSTIGMNVAGLELLAELRGFQDYFRLKINPSIDVNESTAIIYNAKKVENGKTAVLLLGGGSPKNFMLQTEPQIQEVLMIPEAGQDYFIQITDARPDTGGLSGATPHEAVTWGKLDADKVQDCVICYQDTSLVLPLMTAYILAVAQRKEHKRLYDKRGELHEHLKTGYAANNKEITELTELAKSYR